MSSVKFESHQRGLPNKLVCATLLPDSNSMPLALQMFCEGQTPVVLQNCNQSWILCKLLPTLTPLDVVYTASFNLCGY